MRNCQRCTTGEVSWTNDTVRLYGGVSASLCAECQTEWDAALAAHPVWAEAAALNARGCHYESLALAGTPVGEAEWAALMEARRLNQIAAHAVGVEFVKPVAPREAPRASKFGKTRDALTRKD